MSGFLLDTCVISELVKAKPEAKVIDWIGSIQETFHCSKSSGTADLGIHPHNNVSKPIEG